MIIEDFSTENLFYCRDAGERFLEKESVDLFIGHPPYYQAELELNGGDPAKQMQNVQTVEEYEQAFLASIDHMEYALKPDGHMFIALDNSPSGLKILGKILALESLQLQTIRLWDPPPYPDSPEAVATVLFIHLAKYDCDSEASRKGPFVLTNSWQEASAELNDYHQNYATVGAAPTGLYHEIIKNFSKKGDVVCDLFAGCGTVQVVALELGRKFIYNDVSEDKVVMAKKRIEDYLMLNRESSNNGK
jgi:DNA modification methylase